MRVRVVGFIATVQSILFVAHWFVYETWTVFRSVPDPPGITRLQVMLAVLSVSFVAATVLAFRYSNLWVRLFYSTAGVWLGVLNFCFVAACTCWVVYPVSLLLGLRLGRPAVAAALFGLAMVASIYGIINARWVRVKRVKVALANLPLSWGGRVAALVSDVHLGHVNGSEFIRRIVGMLGRLRPDVVFITGDLYDGTKVNPDALAAPWKELSPPFGAYFVTGNHEEFSDPTRYLDAVKRSGIRVVEEAGAVRAMRFQGRRSGR